MRGGWPKKVCSSPTSVQRGAEKRREKASKRVRGKSDIKKSREKPERPSPRKSPNEPEKSSRRRLGRGEKRRAKPEPRL